MTGLTIITEKEEAMATQLEVRERVYTDANHKKALSVGADGAKFLVAPVGPVNKPKAQEIALLKGGKKFLFEKGKKEPVPQDKFDIDKDAAPDTETPNTLKRFTNMGDLIAFAKSKFKLDVPGDASRSVVVKAIMEKQGIETDKPKGEKDGTKEKSK